MADTPTAPAAVTPSASSSTPASATPTPAPQSSSPVTPGADAGVSAHASSGEPPKERWNDILENARKKTRAEVAQEYQQRYGKYEQFETDPWSAVQTWLEQASTHSLYKPHVQEWVNKYTQSTQPKHQGDEPKPDVPIVDGTGQVTGYTYSDKQLRQWQNWNEAKLTQQWEQRLTPIEQQFAEQRQERQQQQVVQQATQHAAQTLGQLREQPYFKEHEPAIRQALEEHEEWGDNVHAAYNHVLITQILPTLSRAEAADVLAAMSNKSTGNTVSPSGSAPQTPRFKGFSGALEYYKAHPEEAEAMARKR